MKRCMVCHGAQTDDAVYCAQCGFSMGYPNFLSAAQAQRWMQQQVLPYRHQWEQKQQEKEQLRQLRQQVAQAEQSAKEMCETIRVLREQVARKEQSEQLLQRQVHTLQEKLEQEQQRQTTVQQEALPAVRVLNKYSVQKTLQKDQR